MRLIMIPLSLSCKVPYCSAGLSFLAHSSVYGMYDTFININLIIFIYSCFPHIVNLACKAMLNTWSGIEFERDPIRKLRGVIQSVSTKYFIFISETLLKFYRYGYLL